MSISSGPECDLPDERLLLFFTCGHPVLPAEDHGRWDRATIEEGLVFVHEALAGGPTGPYVVQATIAALHDEAADLATTDWPQIVAHLRRTAFRRALKLAGTELERAHLRQRLAFVESRPGI